MSEFDEDAVDDETVDDVGELSIRLSAVRFFLCLELFFIRIDGERKRNRNADNNFNLEFKEYKSIFFQFYNYKTIKRGIILELNRKQLNFFL